MLPEKITVVGLSGFAGSGKDYIAEKFFKPLGYHRCALANGFKHKVVGMGRPFSQVFTSGEKDEDTRHLLQQEGTERGRDVYGKDIWINTLESYILWNHLSNDIDKFIISDVRFHNEIAWVQSVGHAVFIESDRAYVLTGEMANHPSEAEMREVPRDKWDFIINNNKGADNLFKQLDALIDIVRKA